MKLIYKYNENGKTCFVDLRCQKCGYLEEGVLYLDNNDLLESKINFRQCYRCGEANLKENREGVGLSDLHKG